MNQFSDDLPNDLTVEKIYVHKMLVTSNGTILIGEMGRLVTNRRFHYAHCFIIKKTNNEKEYYGLLRNPDALVPDERFFIKKFDEENYQPGLRRVERITDGVQYNSITNSDQYSKEILLEVLEKVFRGIKEKNKVFLLIECGDGTFCKNSTEILRMLIGFLPYNVRKMCGYHSFSLGDVCNPNILIYVMPKEIYIKEKSISGKYKVFMQQGYVIDMTLDNEIKKDYHEYQSCYLNYVSRYFSDPKAMAALFEFIEKIIGGYDHPMLEDLKIYDSLTNYFLLKGSLNEFDIYEMLEYYIVLFKIKPEPIIKERIGMFLIKLREIKSNIQEFSNIEEYIKRLIDCYKSLSDFREIIEKSFYYLIIKATPGNRKKIYDYLRVDENLERNILDKLDIRLKNCYLKEEILNIDYTPLELLLRVVDLENKKYFTESDNETRIILVDKCREMTNQDENPMALITELTEANKSGNITAHVYINLCKNLLTNIKDCKIKFEDIDRFVITKRLENENTDGKALLMLKKIVSPDSEIADEYWRGTDSADKKNLIKRATVILENNLSQAPNKSSDYFMRLTNVFRKQDCRNENIWNVDYLQIFEFVIRREDMFFDFIKFFYDSYFNLRKLRIKDFEDDFGRFCAKNKQNKQYFEKKLKRTMRSIEKKYPRNKKAIRRLKQKIVEDNGERDEIGIKEKMTRFLLRIKILRIDKNKSGE
ncbi:MAG: hypothetical protein ACRCU3_09110 [Eubacteriaceae bacterium]